MESMAMMTVAHYSVAVRSCPFCGIELNAITIIVFGKGKIVESLFQRDCKML
jgi:hypothetical protein